VLIWSPPARVWPFPKTTVCRGAGPHGGSRGDLSRGSRPRRCTAARPDPPGQPVGPARAAGLPPATRRDCGGRANPPARGLRRRPRRSARIGVLFMRSRQGRLRGARPRQLADRLAPVRRAALWILSYRRCRTPVNQQ